MVTCGDRGRIMFTVARIASDGEAVASIFSVLAVQLRLTFAFKVAVMAWRKSISPFLVFSITPSQTDFAPDPPTSLPAMISSALSASSIRGIRTDHKARRGG